MMRFLTFFFLILFINSAFAFGTEESTDPKLKEAQTNIDKKEYDKAIIILNQIVTSDPKNADAFNYLGYSYRQLEKLDDAQKNYEKALSIDPNHKGANEYLGELYLKEKNLPKAEERLLILEKACPSDCVEHKTLKEQIDNYKRNNPVSNSGY